MRNLRALFAFASLLTLVIFAPRDLRAQTRRGVTPEDYFSFKFIGDPHISPDGKVVVYVLTTIEQKKNRRESSIWAVPADGSSAPRRLSAEGYSSSSPRWSPDGKTLAFLSARAPDSASDEKPRSQIYLLSISGGGEGVALTKLKNGVQSYQWSPEGSRIVAVSSSGPDGWRLDRRSQERCAALHTYPVQI